MFRSRHRKEHVWHIGARVCRACGMSAEVAAAKMLQTCPAPLNDWIDARAEQIQALSAWEFAELRREVTMCLSHVHQGYFSRIDEDFLIIALFGLSMDEELRSLEDPFGPDFEYEAGPERTPIGECVDCHEPAFVLLGDLPLCYADAYNRANWPEFTNEREARRNV